MYLQKTSQNKKAQEEMVGFVLIMLVVAVIFLVFLGIYIRKGPPEPQESVEISQFLDAMLEVSTSCGSGLQTWNIADLISECSESNATLCQPSDSTKTACEAAKETIIEITNSTWHFSDDSPKTGYRYTINVETNSSIYNVPIFTDPTTFGDQSGSQTRTITSTKNLPGGIHIYLEIRTK